MDHSPWFSQPTSKNKEKKNLFVKIVLKNTYIFKKNKRFFSVERGLMGLINQVMNLSLYPFSILKIQCHFHLFLAGKNSVIVKSDSEVNYSSALHSSISIFCLCEEMEGSESEAVFESLNFKPQLFINETLNTVDDLLDDAFHFFHQ